MAKLFLESTDTSYKVSSNNTTVYGATGDQAVTIDAGLTGITLDALIERVQFTGATTDYKYVQAGTDLKVYNSANALVTTVGLQDDTTGTQLTFANGTVKAAIVPVVGGAPTFSVGGTAVTAIGATATPVAVVPATIDGAVSSAPAAVFSVSAPTTSVTEATGATASFTVSLNAAQPAATTVKVATGSVGSSAATLDYGLIALTPVTGGATLDADGTVHFPAGITTATITVPVVVDSIAETGEGVSLTLSSPNTGATVGTATATVLIADPATPIFSLAASATSAVEGTPVVGSVAAATSGTVTLTVTRSGNLTGTDSVDLTATPGTALASDYGIAATTGQTGIVLPKVTFAPTETTKTITFTPVADSIRESNETLTVSLTNATTGASISTTGASVALTITDDDLNQLPVITIPTTTPSAFISDSTAVSGVSFTDADDNIGFEVTVTAAGASQVSLSTTTTTSGNVVSLKNTAGTAIAANQTANSIILSGTKTDVNELLGKLKYTTNSTSPTSEAVTIAVKDTAGGVTTKTLAINIGQSGNLATALASLAGSVGDDQFNGTLANFIDFTGTTTVKTIDGNTGTDKLILTSVDDAAFPTPTTASVSNVEILDLTMKAADGAKTATINASKLGTALTTVNFTTAKTDGGVVVADNADALTATVNNATTINLLNSAATLTISTFVTPSTADALTVTLAGGTTLTTFSDTTGTIDTLNIQSNGASTSVNKITGFDHALAAAAVINISGSQQLTIDTLPITTGLISGATATGKLILTAGAGATKLTGGSAGDVLTGNGNFADSIVGGAGNDTIDGIQGADTLVGGTGADTLTGNASGVKTFVFSLGDSLITARDTITGLKSGDKIVLDSTYGLGGLTAESAIATGTVGISSTVKEVFVNTTTNRLVIETAADGSTFEEIAIPAAYSNAPFTYKAAVGVAPAYLEVGSAPLTAVNSASGKLTLSGQPVATVTVAISNDAPTVGNAPIGTAAVRTLDAGLLTAFGVSVTGSTGNDTITLNATNAAVDTITFRVVATNGSDVITNFVVANDLINLELLAAGNVAGETAIAANAATTDLTDAFIGVFADGADGTAATTITDYTSMAQVATFLAGSLTETANENYVAVINDLLTKKAYVYNVTVDAVAEASGATANAISTGDVTLVGTITADAALTIANTVFTA